MTNIFCPKCNSLMSQDDNDIYCPKCGFLLPIEWIKDTYSVFMKLGQQKLCQELGLSEKVKEIIQDKANGI